LFPHQPVAFEQRRQAGQTANLNDGNGWLH
jgi:hypothetical protein